LAAALLLPGISNGSPVMDEIVRSFERNNNYIQPFATIFGTAANAGWNQSAWVGKGFGFYLGIPLSVAYVSDDDRTFNGTFVDDGCKQYNNDPAHVPGSSCKEVTSYKGPTILGGKAPVMHRSIYDPYYSHNIIDTLDIQMNDGQFDFPMLPFGAPQIGLSYYFTEIKARYMWNPVEDLGDSKLPITFFGLGFQHDLRSVTRFLPVKLPVNISLFWNKTWLTADFTPGADDIKGTISMEGTASSYGLLWGYTFGNWLEFFLETGFESANLKTSGDLTLNADDADANKHEHITPHVSVDGRNGLRVSLNVALHFGYDIVAGQTFGAEAGNMVNILAFRHNNR
jgi:hypothetical protein